MHNHSNGTWWGKFIDFMKLQNVLTYLFKDLKMLLAFENSLENYLFWFYVVPKVWLFILLLLSECEMTLSDC